MKSDRVHVIKHPLVRITLSQMRDKETNGKHFRALLRQIAQLMSYEVLAGEGITKAQIVQTH